MEEPQEPRNLPGWGALLVTLLAVLGTYAVVLVASLVRASAGGLSVHEAALEVARTPLNLGLAQLLGFAAALIFALRGLGRRRPVLQELNVLPTGAPILLAAAVAGAALQFPLAELGNQLHELWPMPLEEQLRIQQLTTADDLWDGVGIVFALVLVAPATEELLFRGLLLPDLAHRYGVAVALVATSMLFGLSHGDKVVAIYATVAGLVLGAVALRTGTTLVSLVMHASVNAVPVLLPAQLVSIPGFNVVSEEVQHLPLPLLLTSSLGAVVAIVLLVRLSDEDQGQE